MTPAKKLNPARRPTKTAAAFNPHAKASGMSKQIPDIKTLILELQIDLAIGNIRSFKARLEKALARARQNVEKGQIQR